MATNAHATGMVRVVRLVVIVLAGVLLAALTFSGFYVTVSPNDGSVFAVETSWWGFVRKEREIRWMKTSDYDFPGWMAKDAAGRWYLYISDEE